MPHRECFWCSRAQPQLLASGVNGFGTLGTGVNPTSSLPPPDPLRPQPWDTPQLVPGLHGTPTPPHSPKPPQGSNTSSLWPMRLGHAGAVRGAGQQVQWGVGAAQCPGRVPRHPMAAVSSTRHVVSERQPSPDRLLRPTAAGGNAFLEMSPGGKKPHDGSAGRGRDLHCLAAGPAAALPCLLAQTHGSGGRQGVGGSSADPHPRDPSPARAPRREAGTGHSPLFVCPGGAPSAVQHPPRCCPALGAAEAKGEARRA